MFLELFAASLPSDWLEVPKTTSLSGRIVEGLLSWNSIPLEIVLRSFIKRHLGNLEFGELFLANILRRIPKGAPLWLGQLRDPNLFMSWIVMLRIILQSGKTFAKIEHCDALVMCRTSVIQLLVHCTPAPIGTRDKRLEVVILWTELPSLLFLTL